MNSFINFLLAGIIMVGFSGCGSSQKLVKEVPFTLGEVMIEKWENNEDNSNSTNIFIPVEQGKEIELDSVYFREKVVKLAKIQRDSYLVYIGKFKNAPSPKNDIIMHADPKKEYGNKPPQKNKKIPFKLEKNQAVVSFDHEGEKKYYKIDSIKQGPSVKN
ncbi:hypothetical protein [Abyssalbus ytuae]|uniref:Uncharacterized protein n=1 Tax=Abyssalbus ytuae TaxID=2926907 RepID=A0A9E7CTE3_9FLAO|nr:hypothetical protein [Abyssalbus ytuae]UOB16017.1 hypothetical protein MQE35_09720 [Abyssalbus ytuae]